MTALLEIGAAVEWTDADAAATAREHARPGAGRLGELAEWLAATQGRFPPTVPIRVRCVVIGSIDEPLTTLAELLAVGLRAVDAPAEVVGAFAAGATAADAEVDEGADLLVLAAQDGTAAPASLVGVLTGAEPIDLLPRGAAAIDTADWIARAIRLRDTRRDIGKLRSQPDDLLAALDSAVLAAAVGFVLQAAARRTPLVLDGAVAVAAALLGYEIQPRAGRWWQLADTSPDPVHTKAAEQLGHRPLLDLGTTAGDGTTGVLAVALLRAAAVSA